MDEETATIERDESPISIEQLKVEINNLIWMHGSPNLTLRQAEQAACALLYAIRPRG